MPLPARAQGQAQQALANRLGERLGLEPGALNAAAGDFTPERVASRVLSFIEQRLSSRAAEGADAATLGGLLQQARAGIEQGFAEASRQLEGMGLLQGRVAEDVNSTRSLLDQGLQQLQKRFGEAPGEQVSPAGVSLAAYSERFSAQLETFALDVRTRDGDRLRISIAQGSADWSRQGLQLSSNGSTTALQASGQSGSLRLGSWQIEVEGELDEAERAALGDLLGQVERLSADFYAGDSAGAFDQALALRLDGEQLASMSLRLTQSQLRQVSESYGMLAREAGQAPSAMNSELLDYARGLLDALRSSAALIEPAEQRSTLESLLQAGLALDGRLDDAGLERAGRLQRLLLDGLLPDGQGARAA